MTLSACVPRIATAIATAIERIMRPSFLVHWLRSPETTQKPLIRPTAPKTMPIRKPLDRTIVDTDVMDAPRGLFRTPRLGAARCRIQLARASRRKIKKSLLRGNFGGEETYRQRVREKNFLLRRIHAFDHRDTADARDADVRTEGHCDIILGAEYQDTRG